MESMNAAGGYGPPGSGGGWGPPGAGYGSPPGTPPAPPPGGFGAPTGYGPPAGFMPPGGPLMPGAGGDVNTTLPLLLNVFGLILCGGGILGVPLSIIGIVLAIQAKTLVRNGDIAGARAKTKISTILFAATLTTGLVFLAIWQLLTPAPRH